MTMTKGTLSYLYDPIVTGVAFERSFNGPAFMGSLYSQFEMGPQETVASFSGFGSFGTKLETQGGKQDKMIQQFEQTKVPGAFALTVELSRESVADSKHNLIGKMSSGIGDSYQKTVENSAFELFTHCADTTLCASLDGQALVSNTHVNVDGTQLGDNLNSQTLDITQLQSIRNVGRAFLTDRGDEIAGVEYDLILAGIAVEEPAWEIVKSIGRPDNAHNALNMYNGMFELMVCTRLATTFWALIDRQLMADNLKWGWRDPFEIAAEGDLDTKVRKYCAYYRCQRWFEDWRWFNLGHA